MNAGSGSNRDIIALAKGSPGKYNIGSVAVGSTQYLAAALFRSSAGVDMQLVPYKATPDYAAFEREIVAVVDSLFHCGLGNMQLTVEIGRIFDIMRRHRVHARSHLTMVNLAMMTA